MSEKNAPETIVALFCRRVVEDGPRTALYYRARGTMRSATWDELADAVRRTAAALRQLGVRRGDRVVQISSNRYEWIVCDLAIQMARAAHVPLHVALSAEQIASQIADCDPRLVLLADQEEARRLSKISESLPAGVKYVSFDRCTSRIGSSEIRSLSELIGEVDDDSARAIEAEALAEGTAADLASILYTSGTTSQPKGVMLSQRNFVFDTLATIDPFGMQRDDMRLCFLPLSHVFARTCDMYTWIALGSYLALAESRTTILRDCAHLRPTVLVGVPFFYNRIFQHVTRDGQKVAAGSVQQLLGGRLRVCFTGGAAIGDEVVRLFEAQGIPLLQGYGLTETSPVISACTHLAHKIGTVGRAIKGVEVRIASDGEVLTRGPHVMRGYWRQPAATAAVLRDGWLHTGDRGELDEDGFLRITGRIKDLIVTSGGKNVAPSHLEVLLTEDPFILQAMVIGDGRDYLTALIVPNPDALRAEIKRQRLWVWTRRGAINHPRVLQFYAERIKQRLAGLSHYEQVRRFRLLDRGFTPESGELTPTLKLRRNVILKNFAKLLEAMYRGAAGYSIT